VERKREKKRGEEKRRRRNGKSRWGGGKETEERPTSRVDQGDSQERKNNTVLNRTVRWKKRKRRAEKSKQAVPCNGLVEGKLWG